MNSSANPSRAAQRAGIPLTARRSTDRAPEPDNPMKHSLQYLALLTLALLFSAALAQAQDADPIRQQLAAAIRDHAAIVANARYVITYELEARIKALPATATADVGPRLVAEKKAFEATGALPAWLAVLPPVKGYPETLAESDARLDAAYKNAEAAYTKTFKADLARAVRAERQQTRLPSVTIAVNVARPAATATPQPIAVAPRVPAGFVDLLPLIDVDRDSVNGSWTRVPAGLKGDRVDGSGLRIQYEPPEEYDFLMEFTRENGGDTIGQICWGYGHSFRWCLGGWGNSVAGIDDLEGRQALQNRTKVKMGIENGVRYQSVVKVRRNQVSCYLDDRLITTLETDYSDLSYKAWQDAPGILGIETWRSTFTIHKLSVTEITGKGRKVKSGSTTNPFDRGSKLPLPSTSF